MYLWDAQTIQAVWFTASPSLLTAVKLFELVTKAEPESSQLNKSVSPLAPFLSNASGPFGPAQLTVSVQPIRVDMHITGPIDPGSFFPQPLPTGSTSSIVEELFRSVVSIDMAAANRQALVLTLFKNADSVSDSAKLLDKLVGPILSFDDARDYQVQASRRRVLQFDPAIEMNRLLKFGTAIQQSVQFDLGAIASSRTDGQPLALRTIDVNTVFTGRIFSFEEQGRIWNELYAEALRLAETASLHALDS